LSNKQESRTKNTIKNSSFGLVSRMISLVMAFIIRKMVLVTLGIDYLSIGGLFANVLTILSLAELGFGSALLFHFYKPVAEGNQERVKLLMHVYKKLYHGVGIAVFLGGLLIMPFLNLIIKKRPDIDESLYVIYILYIINSALSYFWIYKNSILIADQKEYVATKITTVMNLILMVTQVLVLWITKNFIAYFCIGIIVSSATNFLISRKADKLYPYIKEKSHIKLDVQTKRRIKDDVKNVLVYKVGEILTIGIDNIIITRFVGLGLVGVLGNYLLVTGGASSALNTIISAAKGSVGNIHVTDEKDQQDRVYRLLLFISFWLYGVASIAYFNLLNPFIQLWVGKEFLLSMGIVLVISVNAYFTGLHMPTIVFRDTLGLYKQGKYGPILGAVINLIISLLCVKSLGILGVLLGTLGSRVLAMNWYEPMVNYKHGIKKSPKLFMKEYSLYFLIMMIAGGATYGVCQWIEGSILLVFLLRTVVIAIVPNAIFVLILHRTSHFKFLLNLIQSYLKGKCRKEKKNG